MAGVGDTIDQRNEGREGEYQKPARTGLKKQVGGIPTATRSSPINKGKGFRAEGERTEENATIGAGLLLSDLFGLCSVHSFCWGAAVTTPCQRRATSHRIMGPAGSPVDRPVCPNGPKLVDSHTTRDLACCFHCSIVPNSFLITHNVACLRVASASLSHGLPSSKPSPLPSHNPAANPFTSPTNRFAARNSCPTQWRVYIAPARSEM